MKVGIKGMMGAGALLAALPAMAAGQTLVGQELTAIYGAGTDPANVALFPSRTTPVGPITADASDIVRIGGTELYPNNLDMHGKGFTLTHTSAGYSSSFGFNGYVLQDVSFAGEPDRVITGLRINESVNMNGLGRSNLSFTDHTVGIDVGGRSLNDARLTVDILSRTDRMLTGSTAVATMGSGADFLSIFSTNTTTVGPITDDAADITRVGGTEEYPINVDFDGESFTVTSASSGFSNAGSFNGLVLSDLDFAEGQEIIGLQLREVINGDGFSEADLSFNGDTVGLNFRTLSLNDTTITVDLVTAFVPEPTGTAVLTAMGLAALGGRRRASC